MRRLAIPAIPILLAGCMLGETAPAPAEPGPTLVIEVTNQSSREAVLGYELTGPMVSGSGESLVAPCRRETMPLSSVSGGYVVTLDGEPVAEGDVPSGAGADDFLVMRIRVHPDGRADVAPVALLTDAPDGSAAIPCG